MNTYKLMGTILLTGLCAVSAVAQTAVSSKPRQANWQVSLEKAVTLTQARQDACACATQELTIQEQIEAEEELQLLRDTKDSNATFEKYPYLLDPVYRRCSKNTCTCCPKTANNRTNKTAAPTKNETDEKLTEQEIIDAETELAAIRNTWDMHATFEKYPYLLNPAYRRAADEITKQNIRRQYTNPVWARKVGL